MTLDLRSASSVSVGRYRITAHRSLSGQTQEHPALRFCWMVHGNCKQNGQLPLVPLPRKGWTRWPFEITSNLGSSLVRRISQDLREGALVLRQTRTQTWVVSRYWIWAILHYCIF